MAYPELSFTKDWTDPQDFPTYEPDEEQVRADMQCLFNEIRDYLNQKLVAVMNGTSGAANTLTSSGQSVQDALDALNAAILLLGGGTMPDEGESAQWDLDMGGHAIHNVADPTAAGDAANKGYVDEAVEQATAQFSSDVFHAGTTAPSNTKLLWVDTGNSNILKYYNGTSWVSVKTAWA